MVESASPAVPSASPVLAATPATLQIPAGPEVASMPGGPEVASTPEVANVEIKLTYVSNWACRKM